MLFDYRGRQSGAAVKGRIEADSLRVAKRQLRDQGLRQIRLSPVSSLALSLERLTTSGVPLKHKLVMTSKFASMISSGVPLIRALHILKNQIQQKTLAEILTEVISDIERGVSLSVSLSKHPKTFDSIYINMVRAGEMTGRLDQFLQEIVKILERQQAIQSKVAAAVRYPVILFAVTTLVTAFMLINVVPTFQGIYASMNSELPALTQSIVGLSEWLSGGGFVLILFVSGLIWGAHVTGMNLVKGYGWAFDQLLLKLPLVGTTQVKATTARVSLLMASLFGAGIGVDRILNIASDITTNRVLKSALDDVADGVTRGAPLSQLFQDSGLFPSDLSQMLLVGEETGKLDQMLSSLADYYQQELESSVDALVAILEPLMVVIVGLIIGGLILALYLPVFSLGSTITG